MIIHRPLYLSLILLLFGSAVGAVPLPMETRSHPPPVRTPMEASDPPPADTPGRSHLSSEHQAILDKLGLPPDHSFTQGLTLKPPNQRDNAIYKHSKVELHQLPPSTESMTQEQRGDRMRNHTQLMLAMLKTSPHQPQERDSRQVWELPNNSHIRKPST